MIEEIKSGRSLSFGSEKLRELCKMLPDEGEVLTSAAPFLLKCYVTFKTSWVIIYIIIILHHKNTD